MATHDPNNIINRVDYFGQILIDLSSDTVTPDKLFKGIVAHSASGSIITGTAEVTVFSEQGETGIIIPVGLYTVGEDSENLENSEE